MGSEELVLRAPAATDGVSFLALLLLVTGIALRRDRSKHPYLMLTAFVLDVGLVLFLELTRGAVERATGFQSQILTFHVSVAVSALLLNIALVVSGWKIWGGRGGLRLWHFRLAVVFMLCRVLTLLTAFLIPLRG